MALLIHGNSISWDSSRKHLPWPIHASGEGQQYLELVGVIQRCQSNGINVFLSLGRSLGHYGLHSWEEAETIGPNLWKAYGNPTNTKGLVPLLFGNVTINGLDFDVENNSGNENYQDMIIALSIKVEPVWKSEMSRSSSSIAPGRRGLQLRSSFAETVLNSWMRS